MAYFTHVCGYRQPWLGGFRCISGYIRGVLRRYTINKVISVQEAYKIAERLANKYSGNPTQTLKPFYCSDGFAKGHFYKGRYTNPMGFWKEQWGVFSDVETRIVKTKDGVKVEKADGILSYFDKEGLEKKYDFTYLQDGEFSKTNKCEVCGRFGSKRVVNHRWDVYGWDAPRRDNGAKIREWSELKTCLCTGCWNRAKAVKTRLDKADELRRLNTILKRSLKHG